MKRIVHILTIHRLYQQTDGLYHHHRIGGFDGDDDVVELLALENSQELHTAFNDALGGVAITRHDTVRERTVIHADTYSGMVFTTDIQERHQLPLNLLQLSRILLIGILQMFESAPWVYIVARIDTHLLTVQCRHIGRMGREMDVSYQWLCVSVSLQTSRDMLHILCLTRALRREAHQFATGVDDTFGLCHTAFSIVGIHRRHRLYADRVLPADADVAHTSLTTNSSCTHTSLLLNPCWPSRSSHADCPCRPPVAGRAPHRRAPSSAQRG